MGDILFELNPSPMLVYDKDSLVILKANRAFKRKYKYTTQDIARGTLTIEHIRPKRNLSDLHKALKKARGKGITESGIFCHLSKTGEKFFIQVTSQDYPYKGHEGRLVVFHDLTKRIQAEKKSLRAYEELQQHIANSPLASLKLDNNFRVREWSQRAEEITGYSEDEVKDKILLETGLFKGRELDKAKRDIETFRSQQISKEVIDYKIINTRGEDVYIRAYVSAQQRKNGKFESALVLVEDLTNQKRLEERYKKLFEVARDGIYLLAKNGRLIDCNPIAAAQLDITVDELRGKKVAGFAPEYQSDGMLSAEKARLMTIQALKKGYALFEWSMERSDGELIDVEVSLNYVHFSGSEYIYVITRDITEKKVTQSQLVKNEQLFRNLFLKSPAALAMVDPFENIQAINDSFEKMFGYKVDEIEGKNIDKLIMPPELYAKVTATSKDSYIDEQFQKETIRVTKDGTQKHVIVAGMPVYINGEAVAGFGMYIDITEQKIYENELNQSLEEKQVMLKEIHHRVKNNLAVISGILQLQAFDTEDEMAHKVLNDSQIRIHSIALVHELLYQTESFANISFDTYVHKLIDHIQKSLPLETKNVSVNVQAQKIDMTMNEAIPTALLLNELITNAYKHAFNDSNKGQIDVILINMKNNILLTVADDGKGLAKNFSLESENSLGLNLIKTLAKQLKAEILYKNDEGAVFTFCIPME